MRLLKCGRIIITNEPLLKLSKKIVTNIRL
jgi:hypothetical protein